jgi:hypothetical protein
VSHATGRDSVESVMLEAVVIGVGVEVEVEVDVDVIMNRVK